MPYVEGFGTWPFGEEWLSEATASAYLPLVDLCDRWAAEGREGVLTVGVTPVLADQLELPAVRERLRRFVAETRERCHLADAEELGRAGEQDAAEAVLRASADYRWALDRFDSLGGDVLGRLRELRDVGTIELWTSAATHPVLPMVATEAGIRLQVETGIESHRRRFGAWCGGFWLPECAFGPGLDEQLAAAGVRAFCVDQTGGNALDQLEPVAVVGDAVAVPIDWDVISLVWDQRGYPADPVYRDYHAPYTNGTRPWANGGGPYRTDVAGERARSHARDFVARVVARLDDYRASRGRAGLVVCALDTELLGHWWYEGPRWLGAVVEEAGHAGLELATLPAALERHQPRPEELRESSWGAGKDLATWDSPRVSDLVWRARGAELALASTLSRAPSPSPAAERAARELLALQASDWAFMVTRSLAGDYPLERARGHAVGFDRALAILRRTMEDSRSMATSDSEMRPELQGLAPWLSLAPLLEPPSAWGRAGSAG